MSDHSYEILDLLAKYDNNVEAALEKENSPVCLYAFSPLRENLFEWVELEKGARVLQIGSDYGSYTGILSEKAGEVVVLDDRDENLEVNRLRHGRRGNVAYAAGNLLSGDPSSFREYKAPADRTEKGEELFGRPFDYVFMAGVFDRYKKEEAKPLLQKAAGMLKPGGKLFAAAENEAGVRYWMGADRLSGSFLEAEYRELFHALKEQLGGEFTMYYPLPDYRYPAVIYSDEYLPSPGEISNISARLDGPGLRLGNEEEAMAKACQNGIFPKFANSFLGMYRRGQE